MPNPITYTIENLSDAREFLSKFHDPVILTNRSGSTRYYGMLVWDYIFKKLIEEFPQIVKIIVNVENDHAALFTAIKLNYQNIVYTGKSAEARKLALANSILLVNEELVDEGQLQEELGVSKSSC